MNFDEFMNRMLNAFPEAHVEEDIEGELVIYTNLQRGEDDEVIPFDQ